MIVLQHKSKFLMCSRQQRLVVEAFGEASPVVGSCSPHQHYGFLPDLLGLDRLLVLTARRSDAQQGERGSEDDCEV